MGVTVHRLKTFANCFLLGGRDGFVLVDTGPAMSLERLLRGLRQAGCGHGDLRLVVITHSDVDHIGNCAFLQESFHAQVGMHELERQAAETGDMQCSRKETPDRVPWVFRALRPLGRLLGKPRTVTPDVLLDDGQRLTEYGIDATILHLPGHTRGSIAVLTDEGDLCCGDLFWNTRRPRLHPFLNDLPAARASAERLRGFPVRSVYPAHGRPFKLSDLPKEMP